MSDYWRETIEEAASEIGLQMTPEQSRHIADAVEISHDNYGMAHGHDCIPNPENTEIARLSKLLKDERSKVRCQACGGTGEIVIHGPIHSAYSSCNKCHGEGRHLP